MSAEYPTRQFEAPPHPKPTEIPVYIPQRLSEATRPELRARAKVITRTGTGR